MNDEETSSPGPRRVALAQSRVLLLVLLTAAVYSNTLWNDYHLDSRFRVANNSAIEQVWPPSRFFTDVQTGSRTPQLTEYRPLMPLSHSVEIAVSKALGVDRLVIFHIGNILLHTACAVLFYLLFCNLLRRWSRLDLDEKWSRNLALGAAAVFAVHPISGSAVNYLAARDLLLMLLFLSATLGTYIRMRGNGDSVLGWCATLGLLTLAFFSKLNAVVFFALVLLFELLLVRTRWSDWRLWARTGTFFLLAIAFLFLNDGMLHTPLLQRTADAKPPAASDRPMVALAAASAQVAAPAGSPGPRVVLAAQATDARAGKRPVQKRNSKRRYARVGVYRTAERNAYAMTMAKAHLFYYARNFVWPFHMRPLPRIEIARTIDWKVLAGASFIVATLVLAGTLFRRSPVASFSILSYWVLFSVTSSVFPLQEVVRDYRQYSSLPFLCLALALPFSLCRSRPDRGRAAAALAVAATLYFAISSHASNRWWRTEETFWTRSTSLGGSVLAHVNLGRAILASDPDRAEHHFLKAVQIEPGNVYARINLGMLYIDRGKPEEGLAMLRWVVAMGPEWAVGQHYLARGLWQLGRTEEAVAPAVRAAQLSPYEIDYQYRAALSLQVAGRTEDSLLYLAWLAQLDPDYLDSQFLLGWARQKRGDLEGAVVAYQSFLSKRPDHLQTRLNLGITLRNRGLCPEAIGHLEHALSLDPDSLAARRHLDACRQELAGSGKAGRP